MPLLLLRFAGPLSLVLVLAGLAWWGVSTRNTLHSVRAQLDEAEEIAIENAMAVERIRTMAERSLLAVSAAVEQARVARVELEERRQGLKNVPVEDAENVMSTVLTAALVCLREPATCALGGDDSPGPGGADDASSSPTVEE